MAKETFLRRGLSRRDFLYFGGATTALMALLGVKKGLDLGRAWLMIPPEVEPSAQVIEDEKKDNLGLGELHKTRKEYFSLWPYSRIWVVTNNILGLNRLNGVKFKKGEEYSLIDLLGLRQDYRNNLDPKRGYITGLSYGPEAPFIAPVESQGLSLTANCFARAIAMVPAHIIEWNTHTQIEQFTQYYFDPNYQYLGAEEYCHLGTDATVYCGTEHQADLRFRALEDMTLRTKVLNLQGQELDVPKIVAVVANPLLIRVAVGCGEISDYAIELDPYTEEIDGVVRPAFERTISNGSNRLVEEKFTAYYDMHGHYVP